MSRHREEVLNASLATAISMHGMDADPETILKGGRARPDVIAKFRGLRCAIEGKVGDTSQSKAMAFDDAQGRVDQGIAHLAVAVCYPAALREAEFGQLVTAIGTTPLDFMVITEAGAGDWHRGGVAEILSELRRAHETIVRDDVLRQAVETLQVGLEEVSSALLDNVGACDRLISILGVGDKPDAANV